MRNFEKPDIYIFRNILTRIRINVILIKRNFRIRKETVYDTTNNLFNIISSLFM
jgi:predicted DNA-binding transcriptional regulator